MGLGVTRLQGKPLGGCSATVLAKNLPTCRPLGDHLDAYIHILPCWGSSRGVDYKTLEGWVIPILLIKVCVIKEFNLYLKLIHDEYL